MKRPPKVRMVWRYSAHVREKIVRVPDHSLKGPILECVLVDFARRRKFVPAPTRSRMVVLDHDGKKSDHETTVFLGLKAMEVLDAFSRLHKMTRSMIANVAVREYVDIVYPVKEKPASRLTGEDKKRYKSAQAREAAIKARGLKEWEDNEAMQGEYARQDAIEQAAAMKNRGETSERMKILNAKLFAKGCEAPIMDEKAAVERGEYVASPCGKLPAMYVCPVCRRRFCEACSEDEKSGAACPECDEEDGAIQMGGAI